MRISNQKVKRLHEIAGGVRDASITAQESEEFLEEQQAIASSVVWFSLTAS
jgi:hypothetical protein